MSKERPYDEYLDIPLTEGIVLRRVEGTIYTNIPHYVTDHSPDGYEWGYGGSGPGDLALNAIEALLHHLGYEGPTTKAWKGECFELSFTLHQDFKWQFISPANRDGATIPYEKVREWVEDRLRAQGAATLPGLVKPASWPGLEGE